MVKYSNARRVDPACRDRAERALLDERDRLKKAKLLIDEAYEWTKNLDSYDESWNSALQEIWNAKYALQRAKLDKQRNDVYIGNAAASGHYG